MQFMSRYSDLRIYLSPPTTREVNGLVYHDRGVVIKFANFRFDSEEFLKTLNREKPETKITEQDIIDCIQNNEAYPHAVWEHRPLTPVEKADKMRDQIVKAFDQLDENGKIDFTRRLVRNMPGVSFKQYENGLIEQVAKVVAQPNLEGNKPGRAPRQ